jgi:hypothetical protein
MEFMRECVKECKGYMDPENAEAFIESMFEETLVVQTGMLKITCSMACWSGVLVLTCRFRF